MQLIPSSFMRNPINAVVAALLFGTALAAQGGESAATAGVSEAVKQEMREQIKRELMAEMKAQMAEDIKRQVLAEIAASGVAAGAAPTSDVGSAAEKGKGKVIRVPYVSEATKREIREQLKQEVLSQAKEEHWANPNALPEWLDRFSFEGDIRLRYDDFRLSKDNTPAGLANNVSGTGLTRGADLAGGNGNVSSIPNTNTEDDYSRSRLRLRLATALKISDKVSAGLRISTGGTSGPTSTNQTLGQGFNKYSLVLDRGYLTIKPTGWLTLTGGRIANPFVSTDLVWADDLSFEGFAATAAHSITPHLKGFATAGWFPLRTSNPLQSSSRDLTAVQAGVDWHLGTSTDLKLAAALYSYHGVEGVLEENSRFGPPAASDYGVLHEYPSTMRQRGNTLFITNALADSLTGTTYWGLASGFRELNLTGSLDIARFDPVHVVLTGDYVKNLAFDRNKVAARTGSTVLDGKDTGYLARVTVGYPNISQMNQWNVSLAYRWLGSDAVLDAFTNSDFGMGGTNNKGYILGGSYGIEKNTWVTARWMASQLIDSMAPKTASGTAATKLNVDLLQIDLNSRF